jgi:regulator of sigma E protease
MMTLIIQILGIALGLGFLIFIHELGHFTAARLCKVRVLTFAFGFGPDIVKYVRNGTKYCIKLFPFGGLVAMAGENPQESTGQEGEFLSLPWYKKIFISFAGPFANYVLAILIFVFVFNVWGATKISDTSQIGNVIENYPAYKAGLLDGDIIKSIDGIETNLWADIAKNLEHKGDKETSFTIERGTYTFNLSMIVQKNPVTGAGMIGIYPKNIDIDIGFFQSFEYGLKTVILQTYMTISYLINKLFSFEKPDISGPIGIAQVMADAAKKGFENYFTLLGIISVALGLFNLFPIPFVDGGMIILFLIEGIIRKRVGTKIIVVYNTIGIIIISVIFIFATYSDLLRLGLNKLFK